jgi:hypothetical protein
MEVLSDTCRAPTAWLNERTKIPGRKEALISGLEFCGFQVHSGSPSQAVGDLFVTWNRSGLDDTTARAFEKAGRKVIVIENASWNGWVPGKWLQMSPSRHNTAGLFPIGSPDRWDYLGVHLSPWRAPGGETVALAQRGIGSPPTAMPRDWPSRQRCRVRRHPGRGATIEELKKDLTNCSKVVTWGSAAALVALSWGIPVESQMPNWIGEQDNTDEGRLSMFRRLAWAQWRMEEIASGEAFQWILR